MGDETPEELFALYKDIDITVWIYPPTMKPGVAEFIPDKKFRSLWAVTNFLLADETGSSFDVMIHESTGKDRELTEGELRALVRAVRKK